jgi:hypothetical protein
VFACGAEGIVDDEAMNDKIERLIRLLGSDSPGEVLAAVEAINRILAAQGKTFNDYGPRR